MHLIDKPNSNDSNATADSGDDRKWVVIEDQHGSLASPSSREFDRIAAERDADHKNGMAQSFGIRTRYHALPDSQLLIVQQLLVCRRLGTDIDWRPTNLLPEDYYVADV